MDTSANAVADLDQARLGEILAGVEAQRAGDAQRGRRVDVLTVDPNFIDRAGSRNDGLDMDVVGGGKPNGGIMRVRIKQQDMRQAGFGDAHLASGLAHKAQNVIGIGRPGRAR